MNGGNYFYFSKVLTFLGLPVPNYKEPYYNFFISFNKWSKGNVYFNDICKLSNSYSDTKLFRSKLIDSFKPWNNFSEVFINMFKLNNKISFNLNNWRMLDKDEYFDLLIKLKYVLSNPSKDNINKYKYMYNLLIFKFVRFDNLGKHFMVHIELISKIAKGLMHFFNFINQYISGIWQKDKKNILKPKTFFKYIGRRFIKKYFKFWKFKWGHNAWFFKRKRKWRRNYSTYYRKWYLGRLKKKIDLKYKLINDIKLSIINLFSTTNNYNEDNLFYLIAKNRLFFFKQIKKMVYWMKREVFFLFDVLPKHHGIYDKKEVLLLMFYLNYSFEYKNDFNLFSIKLKDINYQNSLLFTTKFQHYGGGMNDVCNNLVDLMHFSKGSGFHISWDEFAEINYMRKIDYKVWSYLRFVGWDTTYPMRYDINFVKIFKYKQISSIYTWRYFKLLKKNI